MAAWEKGTTAFTCKGCGTRYTCEWQDYPVRDRGEFKCEKCGQIVVSWKGTRDYSDFKLIE